MTQRGSAPVELVAGIALLLLPAALVALSLAPTLERATLTRLAAAEAARAVALADGDPAAGLEILVGLLARNGVPSGDASVAFCGAAPAPVSAGGAGDCRPLQRGGWVEATVRMRVPGVETPWWVLPAATVSATHREPVDFYRSLP